MERRYRDNGITVWSWVPHRLGIENTNDLQGLKNIGSTTEVLCGLGEVHRKHDSLEGRQSLGGLL